VENLTASGTGWVSLTGNDLANTITGNTGRNTIKAGYGNDKIYGGYGNDTLYGQSGKDVFVFNTKLSKYNNVDKIADYNKTYDTIYLENAIFKKLTKTGTLKKSYFTVGTKAADANDYIVYNSKTGYLYYDADGSGKGAAIAFAKLAAGLKMAYSEFKVI
jgi:Ca2+-binding RTX toxin-like protein